MSSDLISSTAHPTAEKAHCLYCFDVLFAHFAQLPAPQPPFEGHGVICPLFVTWNEQVRPGMACPALRGCIGCLKPLPLTSLRDYALSSALNDRRFAPIQLEELSRLQCTVQLLGNFEPCAPQEWTIGVHGLVVSFTDHAANGAARSAVYLPDVILEQGWNRVEAIDSLIRKAGCEQPITDALRNSLECSRFISTRYTVNHDEWATLRGTVS